MTARSLAIFVLAFTGGFTIMSIELLGGRILAPWFGSSVHVWGSIITVFMLSLSVGYLFGGRASLRSPSLRRFGVLFGGGAIGLLPLLAFGEALMEWVFSAELDDRYGSLLAALLMFTAPTVVLGMISPYSVRLLARDRDSSGHTAGVLYFVSTLGSAIGTLLTSFYLVLWFDVNTIIATLIGTLLVCAGVALSWPEQAMSEHRGRTP